MSDATGAAPAGWYEDGQNAGQERYWDGTQWTDQFRPLAPAAPVVPAPPPPPVVAEPVAPGVAPAFPTYEPAAATPRPKGKGLSKGALIGIIIAAVVVVVVIILLIVGASTNWFRGAGAGSGGPGGPGGAGSGEAVSYLQVAKANAATIGASYTDQELLETGQKLCAAAAKIDPANPLGSLDVLNDLAPLLSDPVLFGVASSGLQQLCPDVYNRLEGFSG